MNWRAWALPASAVVLVAAVLSVYLASGGREFVVASSPPACDTQAPPIPEGGDLDALTQVVVVDGVRRAACRLRTSRERLLVALPSAQQRAALASELGTDDPALLAAVRTGLEASVARLERADALPPVSSLLDDLIERMGLPGIAQTAARQIPSDVVDELLPTGAILRRAIADIDLAVVLEGIDDPAALEGALAPAIRDAALAEARDRLTERLGGLGDVLGLGAG